MAFEFFTDYDPAKEEVKRNARMEDELREMVEEVDAEIIQALSEEELQ